MRAPFPPIFPRQRGGARYFALEPDPDSDADPWGGDPDGEGLRAIAALYRRRWRVPALWEHFSMEALEALAAGRRAISPSTRSHMKKINALNLDPGRAARRSGTTAEAAERCYECGRAHTLRVWKPSSNYDVRTFCSEACCVAYSTAKTGVGSEGTPIAKASAGASTPNTPGASTPSTRGPRVIDDTKNDEKDIFQLQGVDFVPHMKRINAPNLDLASGTTAKAAAKAPTRASESATAAEAPAGASTPSTRGPPQRQNPCNAPAMTFPFPFLTMPRRGDGPPDASTLGVSALIGNVGMPEEHSFAEKRNDEVAIFAGIIARWLGDMQGPAVVGLNEIRFAPGIAIKLVAALQARNLNVGMATHESNGIVWRAPPH